LFLCRLHPAALSAVLGSRKMDRNIFLTPVEFFFFLIFSFFFGAGG
jgi:hypothetical protein